MIMFVDLKQIPTAQDLQKLGKLLKKEKFIFDQNLRFPSKRKKTLKYLFPKQILVNVK